MNDHFNLVFIKTKLKQHLNSKEMVGNLLLNIVISCHLLQKITRSSRIILGNTIITIIFVV